MATLVMLIPIGTTLISFTISAVKTAFDLAVLVKDISGIVFNRIYSQQPAPPAIKDTEFIVIDRDQNNKRIGVARVHIILDDVLPSPDKIITTTTSLDQNKNNEPVHL